MDKDHAIQSVAADISAAAAPVALSDEVAEAMAVITNACQASGVEEAEPHVVLAMVLGLGMSRVPRQALEDVFLPIITELIRLNARVSKILNAPEPVSPDSTVH